MKFYVAMLGLMLIATGCSEGGQTERIDNGVGIFAGTGGVSGVGGAGGVGGTAGVGGVGGAAGVGGVGGTAGVGGMAGAAGTAGLDGVAGMAGEAGAAGMAGAAGAAGMAGEGGAGGSVDLGESGCLDGITDYKADGPFQFDTSSSGSVKMWVPKVPAGCRVPMVHLANGTGATCGSYGAILQHLASHGFLTACYESTQTGQGTQCIEAMDALYSKYPDLTTDRLGFTGHSQGGGSAFLCVYRAEEKWGTSKVIAGHAMEPANGYGDSPPDYMSLYGKIESPMFMFNGSSDTLVSSSWVKQGFDALPDSTEAYWYEATGAAHIPIPTRWTEESTVAWFRWKLLGDTAACTHFKAMPDGGDWNPKGEQNAVACQ